MIASCFHYKKQGDNKMSINVYTNRNIIDPFSKKHHDGSDVDMLKGYPEITTLEQAKEFFKGLLSDPNVYVEYRTFRHMGDGGSFALPGMNVYYISETYEKSYIWYPYPDASEFVTEDELMFTFLSDETSTLAGRVLDELVSEGFLMDFYIPEPHPEYPDKESNRNPTMYHEDLNWSRLIKTWFHPNSFAHLYAAIEVMTHDNPVSLINNDFTDFIDEYIRSKMRQKLDIKPGTVVEVNELIVDQDASIVLEPGYHYLLINKKKSHKTSKESFLEFYNINDSTITEDVDIKDLCILDYENEESFPTVFPSFIEIISEP